MDDRPVARSAMPLALGFLALGLGMFTAWLWPDGRAVPRGLFTFGILAASVGVYRLADVVDRAARALIERR
jgi:hypothetical protein